jgi:hypothetical protein
VKTQQALNTGYRPKATFQLTVNPQVEIRVLVREQSKCKAGHIVSIHLAQILNQLILKILQSWNSFPLSLFSDNKSNNLSIK